jgi:hypothetical protein
VYVDVDLISSLLISNPSSSIDNVCFGSNDGFGSNVLYVSSKFLLNVGLSLILFIVFDNACFNVVDGFIIFD